MPGKCNSYKPRLFPIKFFADVGKTQILRLILPGEETKKGDPIKKRIAHFHGMNCGKVLFVLFFLFCACRYSVTATEFFDTSRGINVLTTTREERMVGRVNV